MSKLTVEKLLKQLPADLGYGLQCTLWERVENGHLVDKLHGRCSAASEPNADFFLASCLEEHRQLVLGSDSTWGGSVALDGVKKMGSVGG